jgi:hypothetical protein
MVHRNPTLLIDGRSPKHEKDTDLFKRHVNLTRNLGKYVVLKFTTTWSILLLLYKIIHTII